jgi:hypothetical protein
MSAAESKNRGDKRQLRPRAELRGSNAAGKNAFSMLFGGNRTN